MLYKKCGNNLYINTLKTKVSDFYNSIITNNSMYIIVWLTKIYITYISYIKNHEIYIYLLSIKRFDEAEGPKHIHRFLDGHKYGLK